NPSIPETNWVNWATIGQWLERSPHFPDVSLTYDKVQFQRLILLIHPTDSSY
ncbi:MAG: hypothetical protein HC899_31330, partial [Leptolyngbyaceae cyanobacterium SM1_4_3]|nr:hypothetical protein [Leptolyngbyaceae cyanobacterium SM1_4_3]